MVQVGEYSTVQYSVVQVGEYTVFSNPPMSYARANLSLALSLSGGHQWDYRLQITDEFQYTDYSSLVNGALIRYAYCD